MGRMEGEEGEGFVCEDPGCNAVLHSEKSLSRHRKQFHAKQKRTYVSRKDMSEEEKQERRRQQRRESYERCHERAMKV